MLVLRPNESAVAAVLSAVLVTIAAAPAQAAEPPFRYAEDRSPSTLNPLFTSSMVDIRLEELMFQGLFTYDHQLKPKPALAESCSVGTGGGSCLDTPSHFATVKLRQASWQDGRPITAADVEFTVKVLQDPKTGSTASASVNCIDKVQVKGPQEILIGFKREQPEPAQCLLFKILPKHKFPPTLPVPRSHEFRVHPIGSGPYKLVKSDATTLDLVADGTRDQSIKSLQARFITDKKTQLDFLQYDVLEAIVKILPNHRAVIEGMGSKVELVPYASQSWWYLGVNHKNMHLARRDVREALVHAIDREDLRKTFLGEGYTISGPFIPGTPYYNEAVLPYSYDLNETARLMKQAGYQRQGKGLYTRNGQKLQFRLAVDKGLAHYKDVCLTLQNKLKQAGFDVVIDWVESAAWSEKIVQKRDFDLTIAIWSFDEPSDIFPLFHTMGTENYFNYVNPAMDALLEETRKTQNPELYQSIYREVHKLAHADLPYLFLWSVNSYAAVSTKVTGVDIHPFRFFTWVQDWKWRE